MARGLVIKFTKAEDALINEGWDKGLSDAGIADLLASHGFKRSRGSIRNRRRSMGHGIVRELPKIKGPTPDQLFKIAMLTAIKNGREKAILGVVKDTRPFALNTIHAEPFGSVFGSQAAACIEYGDADA